MPSRELSQFCTELRGLTARLPARPSKGELLNRAFQIPLVWPESEFPPDRPLHEQFQKALATWGGRVHFAANDTAVVPLVTEILKNASAKRASRWRTRLLDSLNFEESLSPLGLEWVMPLPEEVLACRDFEERRELRNRLAQIDAGIIDADLAVAHTGTLLIRHSPERNGFTNLFPWTCIAIVRTEQLVRTVQDMVDFLDRDQAGKPWQPSTIFLTGPSRSGDIDLAVGQGAAGPGQMHVVLIDAVVESA
jgi:L-lactate dehydrogenase complex protein LldG